MKTTMSDISYLPLDDLWNNGPDKILDEIDKADNDLNPLGHGMAEWLVFKPRLKGYRYDPQNGDRCFYT